MELQEHIQYWLDGADHDLLAAEILFSNERYDWGLFLAHLVLEKTLKALFVSANKNALPPRTHNLVKLSEHASVHLSDEQKVFLDEVSDFNLEVRYPEFKREFFKLCTKELSENYFVRIKEMHKWLKSQIL